MTKNGICILRSTSPLGRGEVKGIVRLTENDGVVVIAVKIWDQSPGNHGFHIHRSGNDVDAHHLCDHYNPHGKTHGGLDDKESHAGDLGNLYISKGGQCSTIIKTTKFTVHDVIGRSMVFHANEDDLGKGIYNDSKTTGHSGDRILFGIIGIYEPCG
jgi:superoxide dismutase, Cu-Zn family